MQNKPPENLWSLEAEAAVLGSIILDAANCFGSVFPVLPTEGAFFDDKHKEIYSALLRLYTDKKPIDPVTLRTELKAANQLDSAGGVEYIAQLLDSVPSSANAVYYAGVVRERQRHRNLIRTVGKFQELLNEPLAVDERIQQMQDLALGIETSKPEAEFFTLADQATKVAAGMREHQETIPTGFRNIDSIIGGVSPGELIILAGRPSMGKSALALDFALNMAKAGKSGVFFTLEMPHKDLIERAICNRAMVNMAEIKGELPQPALTAKAHEEALGLQKLDLVLHTGATTPEKQIAFIRTRKKTHGVDVVFVDYLQLMHTGRKVENRVQEISTISRKLKIAAIQEQVPVIALSQLNRQVESRTGHRPRLSDLRESGALEQDADIVMLIHREDYYRRNENPEATPDGTTEVIVSKNRRGRTGIANLVFKEEYVRFGDRVE